MAESGRHIHERRMPRFLMFGVLTMEYSLALFFYVSPEQWRGLSVIYALLTMFITCNDHGKYVRLRYEQEMSLLFKCLVTDAVMGMVVYTAAWQGKEKELAGKGMWLVCIHLLSIVLLCFAANLRGRYTVEEKFLYIYENRKPARTDSKNIISTSTGKECLQRAIERADAVYLYDISAVSRNDLLKHCFESGKRVYFTAKLSDIELRSSLLMQDMDAPVFCCDRYRIGGFSQGIKRVCDVIFSVAALFFLSPVFMLIAICIKREDGGRVFYRQERCTKDMRPFKIIKFRSMVAEAEEEAGVRLAQKKDKRLTRTGYFLRKTKLDELPQLLNILKGEMSFVGPRPERPELIAKAVERVPEFAFRTTVQAGLTGYAQVHGNYHTGSLDKLKWDLMYIENYSLLLDLKILLMTILVVLRGSDDV